MLNSGNEEENKEKVNTRPVYDMAAAAGYDRRTVSLLDCIIGGVLIISN